MFPYYQFKIINNDEYKKEKNIRSKLNMSNINYHFFTNSKNLLDKS